MANNIVDDKKTQSIPLLTPMPNASSTPALTQSIPLLTPTPNASSTPALTQSTGVKAHPKLIILLDASGSMGIIRDKIILAVNNLIDEQSLLSKKLNDEATITIIVFNEEIKTIIKNANISEVKHITEDMYFPDGFTALYDAIGTGISQHRNDTNVLFVIVTDGEENSSKHFNHNDIKVLINEKKAIGWNVIYLSHNDASVSQAGSDIGFSAAPYNAINSQSNNINVEYELIAPILSRGVSNAFSTYRETSEVPNLNYLTSGSSMESQGYYELPHQLNNHQNNHQNTHLNTQPNTKIQPSRHIPPVLQRTVSGPAGYTASIKQTNTPIQTNTLVQAKAPTEAFILQPNQSITLKPPFTLRRSHAKGSIDLDMLLNNVNNDLEKRNNLDAMNDN